MLLTISTTHQPATDLGYLLHKNPARLQTEELSFGKAHVFYPEATSERCTAALLVEIDPVGLVRGRGPAGEGGQLEQYVNDRPYAANSFLSVALGRLFTTAMSGRSNERQELAETVIPLSAHLPVIAARGGEDLVRRLFEPLGYTVELTGSRLDEMFPEWGESPYFALTLSGTVRLQDLLTHLYVLIPVLDNEKHYWVANDEIEKLLKRGEGWLGTHPDKDLIVSRYLKRQRNLTREALSRLLANDSPSDEAQDGVSDEAEPGEHTLSLHEQRLQTVLSVIKDTGAKRVVDLGCGEGKLLRLLLAEKQFETIVGMDVSWRSLETAKERLRLDELPERQRTHRSGQGISPLRRGYRLRSARIGTSSVQIGSSGRMSFITNPSNSDARFVDWNARVSGLESLSNQTAARLKAVEHHVAAYRQYCWPVRSLGDLRLAPFHLLASEGAVHTDKPHTWHMEMIGKLCAAETELLLATPFQIVDLQDEQSSANAVAWWTEMTSQGREGMVVKPLNFIAEGRRGITQPAIKCRGPEYLRIIYGPEYLLPANLERLRSRNVGAKRSLASREFALGIEALERFVRKEPLRLTHECVFGVLALESEPIDPRL